MGVRNPNSTSYEHPDEPNLLNLHKAMQYNASGAPQVRVHVDGISLEGDVIVNRVALWDNTNDLVFDMPNNDGETAPISLPTESHNMVFNGSTWDRMRGNVNDGVLVNLSNNTVNIGTNGTVSLSADTLSALENTTVTISGTPTVNIGTMPEVEIKNDTGNPLPISKNTTVNTEQNPIYVESANVASTSKDRMKITSYTTGFFNTFQHSKAADVWDETLTTGGTSTHDANRNAVAIAVTSTVGSKVIRQTRQVMRYVPGRPAEYSQAVIMDTYVSGVRTRLGQFDEGDGFFLERATTGIIYAVVRSSVTGSPVETRVAQSSWNGDKLDGTGSSGVTMDLTKTQLLVVDYEWYGTGAVQFSFVINNQTITAHTFYHANVISNPWCSTPFIPMRVELENVSATSTASMLQISSCHSMEALSDSLGYPVSIATAISGKSLTTANTYYPVLSIRLKSTQINSVVIPQYLQAGTLDNTFINYQLLLNATLTGASWVNHPTTESAIQYDVTATAVSGGTILNQGFAAAGYNDRLLLNENAAAGNFQIGRSSLGTVSDVLTIVIAAGTANKSGIAVMNWIEQR